MSWSYRKNLIGKVRIYYSSGCVGPVQIPLDELADELNDYEARIAELEAGQRWIPVSEPPKECEMRVFKDGNAWCFVLPDFQDLQVSSSVWMKEGVLDKIYNDLGLVEEREE